jgi:uncharacterized membrane protein
VALRSLDWFMNPTSAAAPRATRPDLLHRFFELGIFLKGIDGALQLIGGLLLLILPPAAIGGIVMFLVRGELQEDPTDLFVNLVLHATRNIIQSQSLASAFLLVHGAVKLLLVGGLARNKLWSYPVAIFVFAAFTLYQGYELLHRSSLFMAAITFMDIAVVVLIAAEYRHVTMGARAK